MRSRVWFRRAALASCAALLSAAGALAQGGGGWSGERRGRPGQDLNAVYFSDSKRGWVGGDGGLVLHTEDGGRTWAGQALETKESISDVYFRDKEDGYLLAGSRIFTTED